MKDYGVSAAGTYLEGNVGGFNQGYIMVDMTDGGVEGHGIAVSGGHVAYHVVHIFVAVAGLVFGKLAYNQTAELGEDAVEFELIEYALDLIYRLGYVLDKEDGAWLEHVVGGVDKVGQNGYVAADKFALGNALAVVFVGGEGIGWTFAAEYAEEVGGIGVAGAEHYLAGHGRVDTGDTLRRHQGMEGGDITESYNPFGVGFEVEPAEAVHNMHYAVAAAGAEDGADFGVAESGFEVAVAFVGGTTVYAADAEGVGHYLCAPAFADEYSDCSGHFLRIDMSGRGDYRDFIALAQGLWILCCHI